MCCVFLPGDHSSIIGRTNANNVDLNRNFPDQYFPRQVSSSYTQTHMHTFLYSVIKTFFYFERYLHYKIHTIIEYSSHSGVHTNPLSSGTRAARDTGSDVLGSVAPLCAVC